MEPISKIIKQRLDEHSVPYFANDNIAEFITEDELKLLHKELKEKF